MKDLYSGAGQAGRIQDAMSLEKFLNFTEKNVEIDAELPLGELIDQCIQSGSAKDEDENQSSPPVPLPQQTLQALQVLQDQEHTL